MIRMYTIRKFSSVIYLILLFYQGSFIYFTMQCSLAFVKILKLSAILNKGNFLMQIVLPFSTGNENVVKNFRRDSY